MITGSHVPTPVEMAYQKRAMYFPSEEITTELRVLLKIAYELPSWQSLDASDSHEAASLWFLSGNQSLFAALAETLYSVDLHAEHTESCCVNQFEPAHEEQIFKLARSPWITSWLIKN